MRAQAREHPVAEKRWRQWMADFGRHVRRVREFLGMSQAELARLSGVSQGAISRFESGRGLNAPFLAVLRINLALATALGDMDPSLLNDDVRRFVRHMAFFHVSDPTEPPAPGGVPFDALAVASDPEVERVVRLFRRLTEPGRRAIVAAMAAFAGASDAE
jgi:transcriptional regulator with XRE-family HTH domain